MVDLAAIQRRIKETVAVLDDFSKRRDPARTRSDYLALVRAQAGGGAARRGSCTRLVLLGESMLVNGCGVWMRGGGGGACLCVARLSVCTGWMRSNSLFPCSQLPAIVTSCCPV